MRDFYVIGVVCIVAITIGTVLFFFGPMSLQSDVSNLITTRSNSGVPFTMIAEGTDARSIDERTNYRITSAQQFAQLWTMIYGTDPSQVPAIDFTRYEILSLFDGSHASGGYGIQATRIDDNDGVRTIQITHSVPASNCPTNTGFTSPYQLIQVPITANSLAHVDLTSTSTCQ